MNCWQLPGEFSSLTIPLSRLDMMLGNRQPSCDNEEKHGQPFGNGREMKVETKLCGG